MVPCGYAPPDSRLGSRVSPMLNNSLQSLGSKVVIVEVNVPLVGPPASEPQLVTLPLDVMVGFFSFASFVSAAWYCAAGTSFGYPGLSVDEPVVCWQSVPVSVAAPT